MMVPQDEDCTLSTLDEENGRTEKVGVFIHCLFTSGCGVWMCITIQKKQLGNTYILNQINELAGCVLCYRSLVGSQETCFHYLKVQRTIKIPV